MAAPEAKVKKIVREALKKLGAWQYWPVSNGMGMHGVPDVLFCFRGRFGAIEVKAPGRRNQERRGCTALQVAQMKKIADAGGDVWVVDCQEEMDDVIMILTGAV